MYYFVCLLACLCVVFQLMMNCFRWLMFTLGLLVILFVFSGKTQNKTTPCLETKMQRHTWPTSKTCFLLYVVVLLCFCCVCYVVMFVCLLVVFVVALCKLLSFVAVNVISFV